MLKVYGDLKVKGNANVSGDTSIDGTLTVGDLNIEGALTVGDLESLVNSLDITPERIGAVPSTRKVNGKELSSDVEDTDYVVAQGTSGIWTYRKWNSGIGECWGFTSDKTVALTKAWGSVYVNADSTPIGNATAYPFVFASNPVVSASPKQSSYNWWLYISSAGNTTTSPSYQAARGASGSITGGVYLYVIGRWE